MAVKKKRKKRRNPCGMKRKRKNPARQTKIVITTTGNDIGCLKMVRGKVAIVPPDQGTAYTGKGAVAKAKEVFNKQLNVRRVDTVASSHAGTLIHDRLIADRKLRLARKWPWNTAVNRATRKNTYSEQGVTAEGSWSISITTKYRGATNMRGAKIAVSTEGYPSKRYSYDHSLNGRENHEKAVVKYALANGLRGGKLYGAHTSTGFVWTYTK